MSYRVVWTFPSQAPAYREPALVEEADELWWASSDIAQLYAVLLMPSVGAVRFRLESSDAKQTHPV
jgi:hypothetical protein